MVIVMDSAEMLLEVLGNESRRRILALLSKKPCYVSEISYSLKMAPKAVLEHLEKLERAGIVRSFEEGRRRYYCIDKSIRIEITITPHVFETSVITGTNNTNFERVVSSAKKVLDSHFNEISVSQLSNTIQEIERIKRDISRIQSVINQKINEAFERLTEELSKDFTNEVERTVVIGISKGICSAEEIAEQFGLPYSEVKKTLENLEKRGIVAKVISKNGEIWKLK